MDCGSARHGAIHVIKKYISQGPHLCLHKGELDFGTRPNMSIKGKRQLSDMRIFIWIAGVLGTEQSM